MNKIKTAFLCVGVLWSSLMITAHSLKWTDLNNSKDFYIGVLGVSAAGLGITKASSQIEEKSKKPIIDPDDPSTWPKE
jgi:hypothetical protein